MRVYINKYRSHWLSPYTILEKVFFWKKEINYEDPFIDKWADRLQPFCEALQKFLNKIHPKIDYVKIDHWDTWSMDSTLSLVILPMLKQLRDTKHGSPIVELEDVPEHLRTTGTQEYEAQSVFDFYKEDKSYDDDYPNIHVRWDWVLNEIIWAFEQNVDHDAEGQFFDHSECDNTDRKNMLHSPSKMKVDWVGFKSWQDRKLNGMRLFGTYFYGMWD